VNFSNNSTGYDQPLSYAWDFNNDGTVDSTAQNPSFVYISPGTYTVKLTVTDFDGSINVLQRDAYITAATPAYTLTAIKTGAGSGTVASSPAGIDCGVDCSEPYVEGTVVTLTAVPDVNSVFIGWSGGGCSGTGNCVVTMNANTTVTATFELKPVRIGSTYYTSLQAAYNAAINGQTIQSHGILFIENVTTGSSDKYVIFQGGYNSDYTAVTGIPTRMRGQFYSNDFGVVKLRNFRLVISQ